MKPQIYKHIKPFFTDSNYKFNTFKIAYETWGDKKNPAILLFTGLSANSHAKSNSSDPTNGWWEQFIGKNKPLDSDKFFIVCANYLGGCHGSTGPSSFDESGKRYALKFPVLTIFDQVRAQFQLLHHLGIEKNIHAVVGSSKGGMASLAAAALYPQVKSVVCISSCTATHPYAIGLRTSQRQILTSDPNWKNGNYYESEFPHTGMKLARMVATIGYRSGPEWELRYGRSRKVEATGTAPSLLEPEFLIETYLDYQGRKYSEGYDPNSLLYLSKSMDLFDISCVYHPNENIRQELLRPDPSEPPKQQDFCVSYRERQDISWYNTGDDYMVQALSNICQPILVLGVKTDILFPIDQQRELADKLKKSGNKYVTFYEIDSLFGHDTFLLDLTSIGAAVKGFLETRIE
eukprot:NODE_96_length_21330_cov_0.419858.p5 type:complete len:404 gc:universal NODE_96_length_21330_cov_0.419858:19214-20425(+)